MDLLHDNIRPLYLRYLAAAFGSAMIASIYSIVDMAMVGNYQGPDGTAALAVVAPIWNVVYSLGLLMGIGGSVLLSSRRASGAPRQEVNEYFTVAVGGSVALAALCWVALWLFDGPILTFFGATSELLELDQAYIAPIKLVLPLFLFNQMLAAFLRNDGAPGLATAGVVAGGIFNMVGDYVFVFGFDWGIYGAGVATSGGSVLTFAVLMSHFLSKRNTLSLVRTHDTASKLARIAVTGFSTFFVDASMGIVTVLFNRQIMTYLGEDALSVYGIIINVSTLVQACSYSVGQSLQPIASANLGAKRPDRVRQTLLYALVASACIAVIWTVLCMAFPETLIGLFMTPTTEVLAIGPAIVRTYALSFLLLPFNILCTYYFQAVLRPAPAMAISVARGMVVSGALILALPTLTGAETLWLAMPLTELAVAVPSAVALARTSRGATAADAQDRAA